MSIPVRLSSSRRVLSVTIAGLAVLACIGYGRQAISQTTVQQTAAPAKTLTLAILAARIGALEAENRTLRERITQIEQEPIIVPMSSISQTDDGYAYYGLPLRQYSLKQLKAAAPPQIWVPSTQPGNEPLQPYPRSPQTPPRILDSRAVEGMTLLKGSGATKP